MSYTARFEQALTFAHTLHKDQRRKGTEVPYITHLIGVAAIVGDYGGDEDQVIAALLHDALEDQGKHHEALDQTIAARFGARVLAMVEALSDTVEDPKPPWLERKNQYIAHLKAAVTDDPSLLISAADKLYNARTIARDRRVIGDEIFSRFKAGKTQTLWYYAQICAALEDKAFGGAHQRVIVDELKEVVDALHKPLKT